MVRRKAFTLLEVLISIALLGLMIVPLFSVVEMMRMSNNNLLNSLEQSKKITQATKVLFMDILSSDGKIEIKKDEFTRLCLKETSNSLYSLPVAKVCWVVLKNKNTLVRIEGNIYHLPVESEERVEVDEVMSGVELFDVYHQKDKVVVLIKQKAQEPISFMVQGITNPVLRVLADGTQVMKDGRKILPNGTIVYKDGSKQLANGQLVPAPKNNRQSRGNTRQQNRGQSNQPRTRNNQPRTPSGGSLEQRPQGAEPQVPPKSVPPQRDSIN